MTVCIMPTLHCSVTNGAKDQSGARSLDKSLSLSLGFGVADDLIIHVGIYLLCLWMWINQNRHIRASDIEGVGSNEKRRGRCIVAAQPGLWGDSVAVPCSMTSISRLATHYLL
jgi:hypothetical protein